MKINPKFIPPVGTVFIIVTFLVVRSLLYNEHAPAPVHGQSNPKKPQAHPVENQTNGVGFEPDTTADSSLQAILDENDLSRRKELLEQWARSLDVRVVADMLARMETIKDIKLRSQIRAALLNSWGSRDLEGEITWFQHRGGADGLHQQARDALAQAMAEREPAPMLDWMEKSMTETGRRELYIPLFQEWMKRDPAGTADALRRKLGGSAIDPDAETPDASNPEWVDMAGQIAAQWSEMDVNSAVNWAQTLPPGTARARALELVSYKWAESNPQDAAAYAAAENDPQFTKNVTAKWAERNPQATASWTLELPPGEVSTTAILSLVPVWTQKDPAAAAAYATNLRQNDVRNKAIIEVVSAWAGNNPMEAKAWVQQFPDGPLREQAMKQIKLVDGR